MLSEVSIVDERSEMWSTPWHARLKNLAEALRSESAEQGGAPFKVARARIGGASTGSWLGRVRVRCSIRA